MLTTEKKLAGLLDALGVDLYTSPWGAFHGNPGTIWRHAQPHYAVRFSIDGDIQLVLDTHVRDQDMLARRAARLILTRRNTKVKFSRNSVLVSTAERGVSYAVLFDRLGDQPPTGEIITVLMEWSAWLCKAHGPRSTAAAVDWTTED